MKNKKGYFFSVDAFIALLLISGVVLFIHLSDANVSENMNIQEDLLKVFSSIKIGDLENTYSKQLIREGKITNLNQSVLEQIGEFYANSQPEAELLTDSIIGELGLNENIGLYFNGVPISEDYEIPSGEAERIWTSRQIISGVQQGDSVRGYSARAFLSSGKNVDYIYFGGYVGDGNLTVLINGKITGARIEAIFSEPFEIYINGNFINSYSPDSNIPYIISLNDYVDMFSDGENFISFKSSKNLYIGGGYIRVSYADENIVPSSEKKYFPGISGLINIYDSFYVPGNLNGIEIFLHYNSPHEIFLNIGDKNIYGGNSSGGEQRVTISNSQLSSLLDYETMDKKTIPFRLGLKNVSYYSNYTQRADVYSVTDLSGSMLASCVGGSFWCCLFRGGCSTQANCLYCSGVFEDKIGSAKQANNIFIDAVLNSSGNRVGLVGYSTTALLSNSHVLSNDSSSLKTEVSEWVASGNTCICCGINSALDKIISESNQSFRSMVVMSDGEANVLCSRQGTGNAKQDAIQAACTAFNNYNVKVYAVGFGSDADEQTLQSIASCGGGNYYYGDVDKLVGVYAKIAQDIIAASYYEQTVLSEDISTELYADSYIRLNYNKETPYGLIVNSETPVFGNVISEGSFFVPSDTEPYEVKVVSYSGSKWTDKASVYNNLTMGWENVFDLSVYNSSYVNLGDPYMVYIPNEKIIKGNNSVRVSTGVNSQNSTGGSVYDKIIYSLIKKGLSYSQIVSSADGCIWHIQFEDDTNSTIPLPENYSGNDNCYYTENNIAYNNNDAFENAVYKLLASIDLNSNRKIETKFEEQDLEINAVEVEGIPFTWETEVQARVWR